MSARVRRVLVVVAMVVGVLVGVVGVPAAQAGLEHEFIKGFNGSDNPSFPGGFTSPLGVAVDRASGNVYVADPGAHNVVDVFSGEGVWQSQLTGSTGSPFQAPVGVAFDQANGDVYVVDEGARAVDVFSTVLDGYLSPIAIAGLNEARSVAVDEATGDVLVAGSHPGAVDVFGVHGEFLSRWSGAGTPSGSFGEGTAFVAVDSSAGASRGDVYVTDNRDHVVDVLKPGASGEEVYLGRQLTGPAGGSFSNVRGVAVDPGTGEVYAVDEGADVVDQFAATGAYLGSITGPPGASFGGLQEGGVAVAANGDVYVVDRGSGVVDVFGRDAQLASAVTGGVSGVGVSGAMLEGVVNPESGTLDAHYYFQYGTSTAYGSTSPALPGSDAGTGTSEVPASTTLSGLAPGTAYHYRLVAVNSEGHANGQDATFQTLGPPIVASECSEGVGNRGVTLCAQVNPDGFDTTYHFQYGTTAGYGSSVPVPDGDLGAGTSEVPASAVVTGLAASTEYHYRIVATNSQGTVDGADQSFVTLPAALVEGESATSVGYTTAVLGASVNPLGVDTKFSVEYGTTVSYGSSTSARDIGFASQGLGESVSLYGLQPGTTYHFRFVASNSQGTSGGVDQSFTTLPLVGPGGGGSCPNEQLRLENGSAGLPDCRAYELVSPADKSGGVGGVLEPANAYEWGYGLLLEAGADGSGVTYLGQQFYQPHVGSVNDRYSSSRGPVGWVTQSTTPSYPAPLELHFSEFRKGYRFVAGFSSDLSGSVVVTGGEVSFGGGAPAGYSDIWLRDGVDGGFSPLITVKPPDRGPFEFGYSALVEGEGRLDGVPLFAGASADLSRVFFEVNDALPTTGTAAVDGGAEADNLYEWMGGSLRLVNVLPDGTPAPGASYGYDPGQAYDSAPTLNLSRVVSADGSRVFWTDEQNGNLYVREDGTRTVQVDAAAGGGGQFWTASTDGSRAFFTKAGELYEFDVPTGRTSVLAASGVQGVVAASEDGSYVYFVSTSVLAGGGSAGEDNLYLSHGGAMTFIKTLSPADNNNRASFQALTGDWVPTFAGRTAEASPSGRYLAFPSRGQMYLYDAQAASLSCASCPAGASVPPAPENGIYQQRYVNDRGELFFNTRAALVAQDVNGVPDVYEYAAGQAHLISSGTSSVGSEFADASANGEDVFFTTQQQLVPGDRDQNVDLYDARVGGGFPAPATVSSCADTSSCRGAHGAPPVFGAPASAVFSGTGNLASPQSTTIPRETHKTIKHTKKKRKRRRARGRAKARRGSAGTKGHGRSAVVRVSTSVGRR